MAKAGRQFRTMESQPGPGDYEGQYSSFTKKGVAPIKAPGHNGLFDKGAIPGPSDYDPYNYDEKFSKGKGLSIVKAGRKDNKHELTPGPGDYDYYKSSLNKHGYAVSKAGRSIFEKDKAPGPGDYEISFSSFTKKGVAKFNLFPAKMLTDLTISYLDQVIMNLTNNEL